MANSVGPVTTTTASAVSLEDLFHPFRSRLCQDVQMISEDRQPEVSDIGSRKRYYDRMRKLKEAHLIIGKKNKRYQTRNGPRNKITSWGSTVYDTLLTQNVLSIFGYFSPWMLYLTIFLSRSATS